jgi:hypothetical protein
MTETTSEKKLIDVEIVDDYQDLMSGLKVQTKPTRPEEQVAFPEDELDLPGE